MLGLWTLVLIVRSIFFGVSLAFSVPSREQPGKPRHGRAQPGPLGGYRLLLEWVFFRLNLILLSPMCFVFFYRGEVHPVWSFRSRTLLSTFQAVALLLAITSDCFGRRKIGSHTNPYSSFWTVCSLFFFQTQSGESNSSGPTTVEHQGRRRSVRWTECVRSPLGQGCARQASFLTGHTQCPRHKKVSVHTRHE